MLRFVNAKELDNFGHLKTTMFKDRARQFKDRLGWDVTVNQFGEERDHMMNLTLFMSFGCAKTAHMADLHAFFPPRGEQWSMSTSFTSRMVSLFVVLHLGVHSLLPGFRVFACCGINDHAGWCQADASFWRRALCWRV